MYIEFDAGRNISVPQPYKRVLTPYLMPENAPCPLDFSIHLCEWEPGDKNDLHTHEDATEAMYVLSGAGTALCGDNTVQLRPGGLLVAFPGQRHVIENTSTEKLVLLCVFSPPTSETGLKQRAAEAEAKLKN
jgi:mannose-6-phosphate isomerase-like protein (cupin superfamily)